MSIQNITCIVCPRGCQLEVDVERGEVKGNSCPRGREHGLAEATNPTRTLTTTVRVVDESGATIDMAPARTSAPIPKGLLFDAMKAINSVSVRKPVRRGDPIIPDLLNTGVSVIATRDFL
ncbi:MAG: DUF1667 domain-containing protein [Thermoguttaceae bacterium]|nr:DUF1667 domain-containing protein [Thermoguttaceae bacterium]